MAWPWRQVNPREPGLFLATLDAKAGDAGLQIPQWDRYPGQQRSAGVVPSLLQPLQADPHKAQTPLPVGIDAAALAGQSHGESLQTADQHSDRHHQQQPIDARRIAQATALQLEDPRFLIAEQLFAAEPLAVGPDQIQRGIGVADQIPGLLPGPISSLSQ